MKREPHLRLVKTGPPPPLPPIFLTRAEAERLCKHITASNNIAALIDDCFAREKLDLARLTSLLEMQDEETNAIIRLCRKTT